MRNQRKTVFAVLIIVLLFTGCAKTDVIQTAKNLSKGGEIDYTVVAAEDIPPTLASEDMPFFSWKYPIFHLP